MKQEILYKKEIENIHKTEYFKKDIKITDALIENFFDNILGMEEKLLLKLILTKTPAQKDLDKLLQIWDIEKKSGAKSLLLSHLLKTNPDLKATQYEEGRLKGLILNQRFININTFSHFKKITAKLNQENIVPLIFNEALIKVINPNFPRYINYIDLMILNNDCQKVLKIIKSLNYNVKKDNQNKLNVYESENSEKPILNIHNTFFLNAKNQNKLVKNIFKRAKITNIYNIRTYTPCLEDILFILFINISDNLRCNKSYADLLNKILDCHFILNENNDINWDIILENSKLTGFEVKINIAVNFINKIIGKIIPDKLFFEKEAIDYSNMVLFENFYYIKLQKECRNLKILNVIKKPLLIKKYIILKSKYKFLKLLNNHPKLIKLLIKDISKIYDKQEF